METLGSEDTGDINASKVAKRENLLRRGGKWRYDSALMFGIPESSKGKCTSHHANCNFCVIEQETWSPLV